MSTIVGDHNYCVNPSFETNTTSWAGVNGTLARITTDAWVGSACAQLTITSVGSEPRFEMNANFPTIAVDAHVHTGVRIKGPAGRQVRLEIEQRNSVPSAISNVFSGYFTLTGGWDYVKLDDTGITNSVTYNFRVRCRINGSGSQNAVVSDIFKIDGVDFRRATTLDTYIDGDQGTLYSWDGTAHASASRRADVEAEESTGTGGVIEMSAALYRTDKNANRIENLAEDIIEGTVTFDEESEVKMSFRGRINDITELEPYVDFVMPVLTLTYANGTTVEEPLGNYMIVPAARKYTYTSTEGELDGRGIEWLLTLDEFPTGKVVEAGVDFVAVVVGILHDMGLTRVNIPLSGKTTPKKRRWKAGTKKIEVVNALLNSAGYTPLFSGRDGALRSFKRPNRTRTQPAVIYDSVGVNSDLVGVVTETPDMENFANRVIVLAEDAQRNTIRAIATNNNPASPTSTVRLGFTKTKTHIARNINTLADAEELADRLLERAARHLVRVEIETLPDPARNPYEIYTLRALQENGDYAAFGNYACMGWTIGFTPKQGAMKHKLERMEIYK